MKTEEEIDKLILEATIVYNEQYEKFKILNKATKELEKAYGTPKQSEKAKIMFKAYEDYHGVPLSSANSNSTTVITSKRDKINTY